MTPFRTCFADDQAGPISMVTKELKERFSFKRIGVDHSAVQALTFILHVDSIEPCDACSPTRIEG